MQSRWHPRPAICCEGILIAHRDAVPPQTGRRGGGHLSARAAGGGLNGSTVAGIRGGSPFNTIEAFKGEFRCIYADLRNSAGQSTGPLEIDRPWGSYTDDH